MTNTAGEPGYTNKKEEGKLTYAQLRTKVEVQAALLRSFEGCARSSSSWT